MDLEVLRSQDLPFWGSSDLWTPLDLDPLKPMVQLYGCSIGVLDPSGHMARMAIWGPEGPGDLLRPGIPSQVLRPPNWTKAKRGFWG